MTEREPDAGAGSHDSAETPPPDGPQTIRRAIRAVALSQLLVADSKAGRECRQAERLVRLDRPPRG